MLIHRYWTGPNPPSFPHLTDADLSAQDVAWLDSRMFLAPDRPAQHRANMVRWLLLYEQGGTWLDCDIDEPDTFPAFPFALFSPDPDRFRVGVMGFPEHHIIPQLAIQQITELRHPRSSSFDASGSVLFRRLILLTDTQLNRFVQKPV